MAVQALPLIIGGLSSLGGSIANYAAANQTNKAAQAQFRDSLDFQKYQYNDMKRYNAPVNQVRLLREAGLNPMIAFGAGNQPQSLTSVGGASPTASMVTPDFSSFASGLGSVMSSTVQSLLVNSEKDKNYATAANQLSQSIGQSIDNSYKDSDWKTSIEGKRFNNYIAALNGDTLALQLQLQRKTYANQLEQSEWQTEMQRADAGIRLKLLGIFDEQYSASIAKDWSMAYNAVLTGQASVKQAVAAVMNANSTRFAMDAQYGDSPSKRAEYFRLLTDQMFEASQKSRAEQFQAWMSSPLTGFMGKYAPITYEGVNRANDSQRRARNAFAPNSYFGNGKR